MGLVDGERRSRLLGVIGNEGFVDRCVEFAGDIVGNVQNIGRLRRRRRRGGGQCQRQNEFFHQCLHGLQLMPV